MFCTDGFTQYKNGVDVENCQLLGCAEGKDFYEAVKKFKQENAWITKYRFEDIKGYEVVNFQEAG